MQPAPKGTAVKGAHGRTRPTNNQLLYRATFQWKHYLKTLYGNPKLPDATEACASVTSAFLQVVGVLFEVERLRDDQPRNILRLLSTNTRRTKVVELSSGTHRVPEELKRHSIGDGEGGSYSTNLDRNRYGSDDQYLATVVRYNLEFLDLCPCLVDITILDAKNGEVAIRVAAGPEACICNNAEGHHNIHQVGQPQRALPRAPQLGQSAADIEPEPPKDEALEHLASGGSPTSANAHSGEAPKGREPAAPSKSNGGSELFDALLMAAAEPQVSSRRAPLPQRSIQPRGHRAKSSENGEESNGDSGAREEDHTVGPLRRSSRKAVRLFNAAALEREGSADSEDGMSVNSMEGDTDAGARHGRGFNRRSDDWDEGFHPLRSRRSTAPQRGASAANLAKLMRPAQGQAASSIQREVQRLQQQLQAMTVMLDSSRAAEVEARGHAGKLEEDLEAQGAICQELQDQVAHLKAEVHMLVKVGSQAGSHSVADSPLQNQLIQEAHRTITQLEREKAALCSTLSVAGLPLPFAQAEIPTPHRNGERPLNGFVHMAHMGLPGTSAFNLPLALPGHLGFQQYQRATQLLSHHQDGPARPSNGQHPQDDGGRGGSSAHGHQLPHAGWSMRPGTAPVSEAPQRLVSNGLQDSPEGMAPPEQPGDHTLPAKRKLEEASAGQQKAAKYGNQGQLFGRT